MSISVSFLEEINYKQAPKISGSGIHFMAQRPDRLKKKNPSPNVTNAIIF